MAAHGNITSHLTLSTQEVDRTGKGAEMRYSFAELWTIRLLVTL
jgi:hypothetical protein